MSRPVPGQRPSQVLPHLKRWFVGPYCDVAPHVYGEQLVQPLHRTTQIRTGDHLRLDASTGEVRILAAVDR